MKKFLSATLALALLSSVPAILIVPNSNYAQTQEVLNNQSIIELVKLGLSDEIIITKIKSSETAFDVSTADLQKLKESGVSNAVIMAMVSTKASLSAQTASPMTLPDGKRFLLEDQTPVKLRLNRNVSSADAKVGDTVDFEVVEDVKVADKVVIPRGAIALGTVTAAKPKGRMGKAGKLDMILDSIKLSSGEKVLLRATKEAKGNGKTGAMVGGMVVTGLLFFPAAPLFLLMKGKDINIAKGTEVTGYVNGTVELDYSKFNQ